MPLPALPNKAFGLHWTPIWRRNCTTKLSKGGLGSFHFLMYETLADNRGGGPPVSLETDRPSSELQLQPQSNIALAPAREHGKSPAEVPDRRQTAAHGRVLRSKAHVFHILHPNGHKPIIIREVYMMYKYIYIYTIGPPEGIEVREFI